MSISDLITLYGLVFAIVALINENNRDYILLKFNKWDYAFFVVCLILLNYLIFFEYFQKWGIYSSRLMIPGWFLAADWAYWVTFLLMLHLVRKVFFSFFPATNRERVMNYYTKLLQDADFARLFGHFEKFHLADLITNFKQPDKKSVRITYAENFFWQILYRDDIIAQTANLKPYVYAELIACCSGKNYTNEKFVEMILNTLLRNKNPFLFREIDNTKNYSENGFSYRLSEENRIMHSLLSNIKVAKNNLIWRPFGEQALIELELEVEKGFLSNLNKQYKDHDGLKEFTSYRSITFFDIMIREAIVKKENDHFWLFYYTHFARKIEEGLEIDSINNIDEDSEFPTNYHYLLYGMVSNLREWINSIEDYSKNTQQFSAIICLWQVLAIVAESEKFTPKFKNYLIGMGIDIYFDCDTEEDFRKEIVKHITQPMLVDDLALYSGAIKSAWDEFDKIHLEFAKGRLDIFQREVVDKLKYE